MRNCDDQIKKNMDEYIALKTKLSSMVRKEGGTFLTKDLTDDIYNKKLPKDVFVESRGSSMFVNLIVVVHKDKIVVFKNEIERLMNEHYETIDASELKRIPDHAKFRFHELQEK